MSEELIQIQRCAINLGQYVNKSSLISTSRVEGIRHWNPIDGREQDQETTEPVR